MAALPRVHPLVWYATAYGGTAALLKGIGFILFLWLAHSLSVEDYATFGLFYALQTGLGALAIAGIGESVIGLLKEHESPAMRVQLFSAANAVFVVMGTASTGLAILLFAILARPSIGSTFGLASVIVVGLVTAFLSLQAGLVRLEERHIASLGLSFVGPLVGLGGGFVGFLSGRSVSAFFLGSAVALSISVLVFGVYGIGFYGFAGKIRQMSPVLARIAPFIGITFFGWLSGYGNNYIVNGFFESVDVAKFTFALTLAATMQLIAASLNQVWGPRFYRIVYEESSTDVERKNRKFFRWLGIAMGLAGGVLIAIFPSAVDVIGGNLIAYRGIQTELFLLFAAYVALNPWWHCQNYFLVHGKGQELMKVVFRSSVIGIVLWLLLMWWLGPIGIYLGFLVQMLVRMSSLVISAKKYWPITIAWDGVAMGLVLLSAGWVVSVSGISVIAAR